MNAVSIHIKSNANLTITFESEKDSHRITADIPVNHNSQRVFTQSISRSTTLHNAEAKR